ncbi:MAG TPA: class I SAM-dependent methyltransferase [Pyrinomonadaceae bacterium]|nr:class I SAM-dependent methyltransferase [Pyrinomonadaceae bacterium]
MIAELAERNTATTLLLDEAIVKARGIWELEGLATIGECPLCSSEASTVVVSRQDGLPIRECQSCSLAYIDPRPDAQQLSDYYRDGYFSGEKDFFKGKDYCRERDQAINDQSVTGYRDIVSTLNISGKTILDVGCATGALLQSLRSKGPKELIGIDLAEYPISFGKARYGLDLRCGTLTSTNLPDQYFDLITLIDVVEHLEDLKNFSAEVQRLLKPGGSLFVCTPNYLSYKLAKDDWSCLYQDFEHLQYFSKQSLTRLFADAGLHLVKCWNNTLPFRLREYPALRRYSIHQILHPRIALKNGWLKIKHKLIRDEERSGLIMNAIFTRPTT